MTWTFRDAGTSLTLLLDAIFSSVALSHMIVDVLNGQRSVLFTYLSGPLNLSNASLGLVSTIYLVGASLIQPVFGYLADRFGARSIIAGGVLWMGVFFTLALVYPGPASLVLLVIASLGSGAFHPAGAMQATLRGRTYLSGKEATAASYFFLFGQLGFFFGPLIGGPLLQHYGTHGLVGVSLFTLPVGLFAALRLGNAHTYPALQSHTGDQTTSILRPAAYAILAFALVAALQAWTQQNVITFVPKYLSDLGQSPGLYGTITALFMGGSAIGNVLGGILADRYGKRHLVFATLGLSALPLYILPDAGPTAWIFLAMPLAGALTGASFSSIVTLAQRLIPAGMALASGTILGFMFSSGALGTFLSGHLADLWGFPPVFHFTGILALVGAALALTIPKN
jgi:FSR family fosmidomycin resistance protein-like MFS transporter